MFSARVWKELPTPRGTNTAWPGVISVVKTVPKFSPARRSTQAPKIFPVATETYLSQGSAWIPRVVPTEALKEMLFCTGPKSGSPAATIFSRCQFSLNQPRASPCTGSWTSSSPGICVVVMVSSAAAMVWAIPYCPVRAYLASVACFWGRHQSWFSWYQAMVAARPSRKEVYLGVHPSSVIEAGSIA